MSFKKEYQLKTLKSGGGRRREEAGSWQEATVDARITHNKDEGIFFFLNTLLITRLTFSPLILNWKSMIKAKTDCL